MLTTLNNFQTENVFTIFSEEELIQSFRQRDQKKLILPSHLEFPLNVRSYFTWRESSGVYSFLIFKMPNWDIPRGVAFKRSSPNGDPVGGLCNWCNAYGASDEIGMLSLNLNSVSSLSYFICQDLRCIEKIEEAAARTGKNPDIWIQQLYQRIEKLFEGLQQNA